MKLGAKRRCGVEPTGMKRSCESVLVCGRRSGKGVHGYNTSQYNNYSNVMMMMIREN